jgi:hypothetical protein
MRGKKWSEENFVERLFKLTSMLVILIKGRVVSAEWKMVETRE